MTDHKPLSEEEALDTEASAAFAAYNHDAGKSWFNLSPHRKDDWRAVVRAVRASPKPLDGEAVDEMALRQILAEEVRERGGPQEYITMLGNRWMEIDSELPPELSAALAAMKRAAVRTRSTQEATESPTETELRDFFDGCPCYNCSIERLAKAGLRIVKAR